MGILTTIRASSSALSAERMRMDIIANNVANQETTRTAAGGPYRRQMVTFAVGDGGPSSFLAVLRGKQSAASGVRVGAIVEDQGPARRVYDPQHPDADAEGWVLKPNIDMVTEMTDLLAAQRAYEASLTVLNAVKAMAMKSLEIGRR